MSITISADDPRSIRAIEIAANARDWRVVRDAEGRKVYRVPSQREPSRVYLVTESSCTCADFVHLHGLDQEEEDHVCKHVLAVRLYTELVRAQSHLTPASSTERRAHLRLVR